MIINCDKTDCRVCNFHHCGLHDYNKAVTEYSKPKGKWIEVETPKGYVQKYQCSNCGDDGGYIDMNFCPNCGSDMRGEK